MCTTQLAATVKGPHQGGPVWPVSRAYSTSQLPPDWSAQPRTPPYGRAAWLGVRRQSPPAASVARFDVSPHSPLLTGACRRASRSADSRPHTGTFLTRRRAQGPLSASPKDSEPLRKPGTAGRRRRTWRARNAPTCVGSAMDQTGLGTHAAAPLRIPYRALATVRPPPAEETTRARPRRETIGRYWYGCGSTCARPDRTGRASRWRRPPAHSCRP